MVHNSLSNLANLRIHIYLISFLCLLITMPSISIASPDECLDSIYQYANDFDPENFGKEVTTEKTEAPNPLGSTLYYTKSTSRDGWVVILECDTCSPKKGAVELVLKKFDMLPCGIKSQMSVNDIIEQLGEPYSKSDEDLLYGDGNISLTFGIKDGRLTTIGWENYPD